MLALRAWRCCSLSNTSCCHEVTIRCGQCSHCSQGAPWLQPRGSCRQGEEQGKGRRRGGEDGGAVAEAASSAET